jgi:hypothetical protein
MGGKRYYNLQWQASGGAKLKKESRKALAQAANPSQDSFLDWFLGRPQWPFTYFFPSIFSVFGDFHAILSSEDP